MVATRAFVGLDLGQARDYTALAVLTRTWRADADRGVPLKPPYAVPHLQRFPLGTPYPQIVAQVLDLLCTPQLKGAFVVVDQTGVGRAVVDMITDAMAGRFVGQFCPVTVTAGHEVTLSEAGEFRVPKKELVGVLQVLLPTRRLRIAQALPEAAILAKELETFQVKITEAAKERRAARRPGAGRRARGVGRGEMARPGGSGGRVRGAEMADDTPDERITYVAGLSLGQASEASGFAVLERRCRQGKYGDTGDATYAIRHLVRYPPGTPYAAIVAAVTGVFAEKPLKDSVLIIDRTAVGRGVYDLFLYGNTGAGVWGLAVTAGHSAGTDDRGGDLVPKKDLVGVLQVLLQGKRLTVAQGLEFAGTLAEELQQFRLKTVSLTDDVVEWRERPHDDLVFAVASRPGRRSAGPGSRS
jgi:hypothetical protein